MRTCSIFKVGSVLAIVMIGFGLALVAVLRTYITDLPNTDPYLRVEFVTPSTGFIVGSRLLQTTDGGKTWKIVRRGGDGTFRSPGVVESLHRFQFINQEVGIARGRDFLRRTSDGGQSWPETYSMPMDREHRPPSFFFISPKKGWVAGANVYSTEDGGQNWERLAATPTGDEYQQPLLWFNTSKDGLVVTLDGMVQLTNDGGRTWQYVFDAGQQLTNVFFTDSSNGWIVGFDGYVARTQDGGRTWKYIRTPTSAGLFSVHFINPNSGCAVGTKCTIICTKDGGVTWNFASVKSLPDMAPILASVSFANELNGWAVGGFGYQHSFDFSWLPSKIALTTKDGGQTWEPVDLPH